MMKNTDAAEHWFVLDAKRSESNLVNDTLRANTSGAENAQDMVDFTANGFKLRTTVNGGNTGTNNYIFLAFAESPFKHSNAR
jgi:hypothetical protein